MTFSMKAPGPAEAFTLETLDPTRPPSWYHVYCTETHPGTTALSFNQGWGCTRFAPIAVDGETAHTYYLASNEHTAYLESVLHDVPLGTASAFPLARLAHFHLVRLQFTQALRFVSFHSAYLPKLALTRAELVDSATDAYPVTRQWAAAAFSQEPTAQAIGYGSRRHDAGRCLMLMRQRMPDPPFTVLEDRCVGTTPHLRRDIIELIDRLGVDML